LEVDEGEKLVNELATSLKYEVQVEVYAKLMASFKIFGLNFSRPFLQKLAPYIKEVRVGPEETFL
jgi:hypothetical protein